MIARVGQSALEWRWSEDLAISWIKCLETAFKISEKVKVDRFEDRQELLISCINLVAVRGVRLSWNGQVILLNIIQTMVTSTWIGTDHVRLLVQTVLGERGLLPQAFIQTTNRGVQMAAVNLVKDMLQSKNVVILQDVYSLLCMRLEQAITSLNNSKVFLPTSMTASLITNTQPSPPTLP